MQKLWDSIARVRWALCIAFIALYYLGAYRVGLLPLPDALEQLLVSGRIVFQAVDALMLVAGMLTVYPAIVGDYLKRVESGLKALDAESSSGLSLHDMLEHARWCNVKLYAVMTVVLGLIGATLAANWVPQPHEPVALALSILILIALFDSLLDLEAEWTMTILAAARSESGKHAEVIWRTNQFRPDQLKLLSPTTTPTNLRLSHTTATAQNIVAFAVVVVVGTMARVGWLLVASMTQA